MSMHAFGGPGGGTSVPILECPSGKVRKVLFLGPIHGTLQHYISNRSSFCYKKTEKCRHCGKVPRIWYGYAPGRVYRPESDAWWPVIVQVTANLEMSLHGRNIRGELWELMREPRKNDRGPVTGNYLLTVEERSLSPAFKVEHSLLKVFGADEIPDHVENPAVDQPQVDVIKMTDADVIAVAAPTIPPVSAQKLPEIVFGSPQQPAESHEQYRDREKKEFHARQQLGRKPQ